MALAHFVISNLREKEKDEMIVESEVVIVRSGIYLFS